MLDPAIPQVWLVRLSGKGCSSGVCTIGVHDPEFASEFRPWHIGDPGSIRGHRSRCRIVHELFRIAAEEGKLPKTECSGRTFSPCHEQMGTVGEPVIGPRNEVL